MKDRFWFTFRSGNKGKNLFDIRIGKEIVRKSKCTAKGKLKNSVPFKNFGSSGGTIKQKAEIQTRRSFNAHPGKGLIFRIKNQRLLKVHLSLVSWECA